MKQVYLLSGISGSGKSTWVNDFVDKNPNKKICVLSSDDLREEMGMSPIDNKVFEIIQQKYNEALSKKHIDVIIVDATNLTHKKRLQYKRKNVHVTIVLFFTSLHTAINRVKNRDKNSDIPFESIKQQSIALTPPIIGYDCDSFELTGELFFNYNVKKMLYPTYRLFLSTINSLDKFMPLIIDSVKENELNGLYRPHNSLFHSESINEHIDLCLNKSDSIDMRIVSLFHDLGKPLARVDSDKKGYTNFKRHERFSSILFLNFLYSFDKNYKERQSENSKLLLVIYFHMLSFSLTSKVISKYKISEETIDSMLKFNIIDRNSSIEEEL